MGGGGGEEQRTGANCATGAGAAMAPAGNRFQTVFIGNLSYDGTEDELRSLFAQMGPISTLRVVIDRETGKRKGFAFLEFFDPDTAQRAVRELNGLDFYGRELRVSIAEQDTKHAADGPSGASRKRKGGPAAPAGPPGSDRVASVIAGTASAQLYELMQQAKGLAANQPHDLLALLRPPRVQARPALRPQPGAWLARASHGPRTDVGGSGHGRARPRVSLIQYRRAARAWGGAYWPLMPTPPHAPLPCPARSATCLPPAPLSRSSASVYPAVYHPRHHQPHLLRALHVALDR